MASASVSSGTSPLSGFEFDYPPSQDPNGNDQDEFWTAISHPSSGSLGSFLSSPAAHSLGSSWAVLGNGQIVELEPSPAALPSPIMSGDFDQLSSYSGAVEQSTGGTFGDATGLVDLAFLNHGLAHNGLDFLPQTELVFDDQFGTSEEDPVFNHFSSASILEERQPAESVNVENSPLLQTGAEMAPWQYVNLPANDGNTSRDHQPVSETSPIFIIEDPSFKSPSPSHEYYSPSLQSSVSPPATASPHSPIQIKLEAGLPDHRRSPTAATASTTGPKAIPASRKLNANNRVQKRKAPTSAAPHPSPTSSSNGSSTAANKFLIVTPSSITAAAAANNLLSNSASTSGSSSSSGSQHGPNHPHNHHHHHHPINPFECLDALTRGPTQRGRKGPLATDTKQSALVVRRMGACFSCHARKVRCDKERPCRNCVRLSASVPQVVCWQFGDFTTILFPSFIRAHLKKDEVARFVEGNVESFTVNGGVEVPCTVELVSGVGFGRDTVLRVQAKFFTARTMDVLQHWHVMMGRNGMDLVSRGAAPIGLEMGKVGDGKEGGGGGGGGDGGQKAELKRRVREYVQALVDEPRFAELVTPAPQHTELPRRVLAMVHDYARRADVPMVRRALSIYAMHFVMTRHLCLTAKNIADLQSTGLVPQGVPWVTPRVLNRQLKAIVDEMLCREMQLLFENFSKSLKPKLRREWAPCLASFLVLCLFMESVELAADLFVVSDNEINLRHHYAPAWKRSFVLGVNSHIENMPFKQFAFQFHQIYQTHSRDAAARSFNPLVDDACFELGELDREAGDMVRKLRRFIDDDWSELDYLTADPILPNIEDHPYPRNVAHNYTGRLVAKFLLSFTDEKYIFDGKT
ncbi:hypothetical protein N658DRAFT_413878 [Parathielavia hyrcaniae]|uniref:Zn(2)-C6 fungal-type domain-containing protein n=1 Tax=Parathielavia hyrcaniae TaxID=113614 RepID=A0AAN6T5Z9_9PEZI|nr:hypothetical protein N658DRAFT_413878 [Parathielavia hyrcaniae]